MSGVSLLQRNAAMPHLLLVVCLSALMLATLSGCEVGESNQEATATAQTRRAPAPAAKPETPPADEPVSAAPLPEAAAAETIPRHGHLVQGLDGELYLPYAATTINRVQSALKERGLYQGPVHGILDPETMKSIYAFQEATTLQRCGVPTPRTRTLLMQGSHTDPAS